MPDALRIDLHAHSTASDGTDSPSAVMRAAREAALDVVALTDHDTTAGWDEAAAAVASGDAGYADRSLRLVRGAELSCRSGGVGVHLLAYLFDPAEPRLRAEMGGLQQDREPRAREIVRRLEADGVPVSWDDVLTARRDGATIGRPHVADALVSRGVVASRDEAFGRLLHRQSPYFVPHHALDAAHAVALVAAAGGVSVLAHPFAARRGPSLDDDAVEALARAGLDGLEADHPDHDDAAVTRVRSLAGRLGLVVTGSSDYHGTGKRGQHPLGARTTDPEQLDRLLARAHGVAVVAA